MIHQYKLNGYNIVIDVNSGAIHAVDEVAYDIIGMVENTPEPELRRIIRGRYGVSDEEISEVLEDIETLRQEHKLFSEDPFAEAADAFKNRQSVLKAICLHVAHACNMDCAYCFAGKGQYHGDRGLMSYETGRRALDWLVEQSGDRHHLEVDFFGGEPLLNWDVVKRLVAYGRSLEKEHDKEFRFTLTTNGLLIDDDVIEFSRREMGNVVLSLDGRPQTNDAMRRTPEGGGTYDLVVDKFRRLAASREQKDYYMRGTYTARSLDFASDILHMADLGFRELSMEPVVADPSAPYALRPEHAEQLCREYERLAVEMIRRRREGRGFHFYHYTIDLTGGPCIAKRIAGCGVGTEYMAVTPEGDLYPCHQFVGESDYRLGDIWHGVTRPQVLEPFRACNVYSHEECRDCFARLYCSGGCAANAVHTTGRVDGVYELGCVLHRKADRVRDHDESRGT
ncbi:MAG: thioether cross-link-forming SCIFF peptide maturase [Anaerovoracaceae bacterium]